MKNCIKRNKPIKFMPKKDKKCKNQEKVDF